MLLNHILLCMLRYLGSMAILPQVLSLPGKAVGIVLMLCTNRSVDTSLPGSSMLALALLNSNTLIVELSSLMQYAMLNVGWNTM
jgi:hypothetical protein